MNQLLSDGRTQISLSESQYQGIKKALHQVHNKTQSKAVILSDSSGLVIAAASHLNMEELSLLSALAAADYAATSEMAKVIGEGDTFETHLHEGKSQNIYICSTDSSFLAIVIFPHSTSFGMVRIQVSKAIKEIKVALKEKSVSEEETKTITTTKEGLSSEDFQEELSARLTDALTSSSS